MLFVERSDGNPPPSVDQIPEEDEDQEENEEEEEEEERVEEGEREAALDNTLTSDKEIQTSRRRKIHLSWIGVLHLLLSFFVKEQNQELELVLFIY